MRLQDLFASLSEEQRNLQLGFVTDTPLTHAFTSKRAVHAGLSGRPVSPDEVQGLWDSFMDSEPPKGQLQTAYVHIPFCQTKCTYCGFFQNATNQEVEDRYVDLLVEEIARDGQRRRIKDGIIQTVFIGGGTPTALSAGNAKKLLQALQTYLPLANDYELTLEGRIHDLVPEKMDVWMSHGVNRMSLGVQSFHTKVRRQLGRIDDQETIMRRLEELKAYQQCAVIVDLIYGLPDQTMDVWLEDLRLLEESAADGMDLYQLNVFENSELNRLIQAGKVSPAATSIEQALMYEAAVDFVEKRNFRRLSSCHWSRSPRERSMYNTMAKAGYPMFPFGCGAGGNVNGYMTMLHRVLAPYEGVVASGGKPCMVLMKQSELQPIADFIVSQLEQGVLDLRKLIRRDSRLEELTWLMNTWVERGLMTYNGVLYRLTTAGEFWHINVTQTTLECMQLLLTGESSLLHENIAAQDGLPKGHPKGMPTGTGAMQGQGARLPHGEKPPHGRGAHPVGVTQGGKSPHGMGLPPHGLGGPEGHPGGTKQTHGTVGHSPFKVEKS